MVRFEFCEDPGDEFDDDFIVYLSKIVDLSPEIPNVTYLFVLFEN